MTSKSEIILYQADDGDTKIQVTIDGENVWLSIDQMSELFQRDKSVIAKHIRNVIAEGELNENSVVAKFATTGSDGKTYQVGYYNLDMIISVGYRVQSHRGVQFRVWATKTLREYIVKGFVIDDDRLSGKQPNYFDELVERVRKIRTSEKNLYAKVKEIFATSIDYDNDTEQAKQFFSVVQNKFHYAITGLTAAETVVKRVNAAKPKMGVITTKRDHPTRAEAEIGKNYLDEPELKQLELLVEQFLSHAEFQVAVKRPMYMNDWIKRLDAFILFNERALLDNAGAVSSDDMRLRVGEEYEVYQQKLLMDSGEGEADVNLSRKDMPRGQKQPGRTSQKKQK